MAVTILSSPDTFIPIYSIDGGDSVSFVLSSTYSNFCSMKYVAEVYVNSNYITTVKNSPNLTNGKCVMSFNRIIEDFVSYDKWVGPNFQIATSSIANYQINFGEETDGTYDCSDGEFVTNFSATFSGKIFNGTIQYGEDFDIDDYYVGDSDNSDAKFLTNMPSSTSIQINETSFLYYISENAVTTPSPSPVPSADHALEVRVNHGDGSSTNYYVLNIRPSPANVILSIAVGPENINDYVNQNIVYDGCGNLETDPILTCDDVSYQVRISDYTIVC